jgi:MFS family permease
MRELRLPLLLMAVLFCFSFNFVVILPLMAQRAFEGGAGTYGAMLSVMGAGSFVGALALANRPTPSVVVLGAAGLAVGAFSLGAATAGNLGWEWACLAALGFASISFMISGNTTLQLTAAPAMRGRVMSLYSVVFLGSTPIGAPIAGWIAQHLGPRVSLGAGGVIAVVASTIALWVVRRAPLARLDEAAPTIEAIAPVGSAAPVPSQPADPGALDPGLERSLSA